MKKTIIIALLLVAVFGIIGALTYANRAPAPEGALVQSVSRETQPVQTVVIEPEDLKETLVATGVLKAEQDVVVTAEVTGKVLKAYKNLGDRCTKGALLFRLDSESFRIAVAQAEAALEQARVALDHSERDWKRIQKLKESAVATAQQLDGAEGAVRSGAAAVAQAEAALRAAKRNLRETNVRCPFTGFVAERMVDAGQTVNPATPLARLVDMSRLKLAVSVTSDKLGRVAVGQKVELSDPAIPDRIHRGEVARLGVAADPITRTFPLEIYVDKHELGLRAGQVVHAKLELAEYTAVFALPPEALVRDGEETVVFVVKKGTASRVPVTVGPEIDGRMVILNGLKKGNEVVVLGASTLRAGEKVEVTGRAAVSRKSVTTNKANGS